MVMNHLMNSLMLILMIFNPIIKMRFILIALFICTGFFAQNTTHNLDYYFSELDSGSLESNIPTPKEIIGHEVGEWHVSHDKLVQYMYALANASDRVSIEDRGFNFADGVYEVMSFFDYNLINFSIFVLMNLRSFSESPW